MAGIAGAAEGAPPPRKHTCPGRNRPIGQCAHCGPLRDAAAIGDGGVHPSGGWLPWERAGHTPRPPWPSGRRAGTAMGSGNLWRRPERRSSCAAEGPPASPGDGQGGRDASRRDGAGEARPGSPATCNAIRGESGGWRGGKSLPTPPPPYFYKKSGGGLGEKPLLGKCVRRGRFGGGGERIGLRGWGQPRRQPR